MPIDHHYDADQRIIYARAGGVVSLQELMAYGDDILGLQEDLSGAIEYVDFSNASDIAVTYKTARQMVEKYKGWASLGIRGSVIFAPSDLCYGIARMIGSVIAAVARNPEAGAHVTRTPLSPDQLHDLFRAG
jgi:hypothetical protein